MQIRDTRNGSWYWVNTAVNACSHISHADKSVYGALASFSGFQEIRPSFEEIAKRSNASIRQAKKSIKNLSSVEIISIVIGGGRGRANVYQLNKCAKGCKLCTVSENIKGCKIVQETVQKMHLNGAKNAPHIDTTIDRDIDNLQNGHSAEDNSHKEIVEVIDAFKEINPSYEQLFKNKTQRGAAERLLKKNGLTKVKEWVKGLKITNSLPYAPIVITPHELERKIGALKAFVEKSKN